MNKNKKQSCFSMLSYELSFFYPNKWRIWPFPLSKDFSESLANTTRAPVRYKLPPTWRLCNAGMQGVKLWAFLMAPLCVCVCVSVCSSVALSHRRSLWSDQCRLSLQCSNQEKRVASLHISRTLRKPTFLSSSQTDGFNRLLPVRPQSGHSN